MPLRENRQVRLVARPRGIPQAEHFSLVTEPVAAVGKGEILIQNRYLSVDPAQRGWANDEGNYSAPVPLDTPMRALAVGEVLESNAPEFRAGQFVYGWRGSLSGGPLRWSIAHHHFGEFCAMEALERHAAAVRLQ